MKTKQCIHCQKHKPTAAYYDHPMMGDGKLNKCKPCCRLHGQLTRSLNLEYYRAYDRMRHSKLGRRPSKPRASWKEKANNALSNALRDGKIIRKPCAVCGKKKTQAHHPDYKQPLAVVWLCKDHHWKQHRRF